LKNNFILLLVILICPVFPIYNVGDQISETHQNMESSICHGDYPAEKFRLSDFQNKVIWLHFSATWWAPCFGFIPVGEEVEEHWKDNENVAIIDFLDDISQPYSCSQWGSVGNPNLPIIIDDGGYDLHDQFHDIYPTNVFIDHEMRVHAILDTLFTADSVNVKIQEMLDVISGGGCIDPDACNYDADATTDDCSCSYLDCNGTCGGPAVEDVCGTCDGGETDVDNCQMSIHYDITVANQFQIQHLYPNPFNPVLHINFDILWPGITQVDILNIAGTHIETLYAGFFQSGSHKLSWNAESMPSGIYLVSFKSGGESLTEKVVLLKWLLFMWPTSQRENNRFIIDEIFSNFTKIFDKIISKEEELND